MSACAEDEQNEYEEDEHTDYDYEALECLRRVIFGLLQYEPEKRVEADVAVSWIREKWTDYRKLEREEESEDEEDQDVEDEDSVAGSELDE
jgi:hypothetical protein